jgi:chemotaxis protein MotB
MAKEEPPRGAPLWMCTFSDMMSLLLCFFILLFALSTLEKVKYKQTIGNIQGSFGRIPNLFRVSYRKPISIRPQEVQPVQRTKTVERAKEAIAEKSRSKLVVDDESREVIVEGVKDGIRFSLSGRILFDPGTAVLNVTGKEMLNNVLDILRDYPDLRVRVEGHTDDQPAPNSIYSDNWKLAEARAWIVQKYLTERDYQLKVNENEQSLEHRISFMSCGSYRPRFQNDTPENRALNRRVEIMLIQGSESITVPGELQGTGKLQTAPNESDILPMR